MGFSKPTFKNSRSMKICLECGTVSDPKITQGICPVCLLLDRNLLKEMVERSKLNAMSKKHRRKIITKEKLLEILMNDGMIYNHAWWFRMSDDGRINGGCDDVNCCHLEYENFEEMYKAYDEEKWRI